MEKRKLVLVLGMHRSGTSVITRGLKALGVDLGENMIPHYADNIKGFWEDADFKSLNEAMLASLGESWHSLNILPRAELPKRLAAFHFKALDLVKAKSAASPVLGVKDPRFCRLLPFWQPILAQANLDVSYIIPVRNPLSVAHSLQRRNGFDLEKSLLLWLEHMLASVLGVEDQPALVVDYDRMLASPRFELTRMATFLGAGGIAESALAEFEADYLEGGLRHAQYALSDLQQDPLIPQAVTDSFAALLQLSEDGLALYSSEVITLFKQQQAALDDFAFLFQYLDRRDNLLVAREGQIRLQEKTIQQHVDDIQKQSAAIAERNQVIEEKNQLVKEKFALLGEKDRLLGEKNGLLAHKDRELASYRQELAEKEQLIKERNQHVQSLNQDIVQLRSAHEALLVAPEWAMAKKMAPLLSLQQHFKPTKVSARALRLLNQSGLFAADWYARNVLDTAGLSPAEHYLREGWKAGISPHPLFDPAWYLGHYPDLAGLKVSPLLHYLEHGWKERRQPHPAFPVEWYLEQNEDIALSAENPLVHYQRAGGREARQPHPLFAAKWYLWRYGKDLRPNDSPLSHYLMYAEQGGYEPHPVFNTRDYRESVAGKPVFHTQVFLDALQRVENFLASPAAQPYVDQGIYRDFDTVKAARFVQSVRRREASRTGGIALPMVSIIMPTHNRLDMLPTAVDSVLAQSYPNWELWIVDDGSEDGTAEYIANHYHDPRIQLQRTAAKGVCHARNVGLAAAQGEWIAYLDSDNTWAVDFLELMLAHIQQEGADFAYSAVRMLNGKGEAFRFHAFDANSLVVKNFIDLNAIVHHRRLYDTLGGFDEQLARMVDWDVIIRYTRQAEKICAAPFIGVHYDNRPKNDRITVKEPVSWRYVVMNKHLINWPRQVRESTRRDRSLVSVVIPVYGQLELTRQCVVSLLSVDAGLPFELILVDNGSSHEVLGELYFWSLGCARITLVRNPDNYNFALGCNLGFAHSRGYHVVFLNNDTEVTAGWLAALVQPLLDNDAVGAVQPKLLYPDGRVQCAGVVFSERSAIAYPLYVDSLAEAPHVQKSRFHQAVSAACLAVRSDDFAALQGFDPLYINGQEDIDFCFRLRAQGKQAWYEASSTVIHHESRTPGRGRYVEQNRRLFVQRWQNHYQPDDLGYYQADGFVPVGWRHDGVPDPQVAGYLPLLRSVADATALPLLFAIKVPCPSAAVKEEWGDYHFARSLGAALQRRGYAFRIDFLNEWDRGQGKADEINLVLRGLSGFTPRAGQINLLWMISHPDKVGLDELQGYDHVFVASALYARGLAAQLGDKVSVLLQCTDPGLFYPDVPEPVVAHPLLFVGNSRNQFREVLKLSLAAGLQPAVYGSRWQAFIPPSWVKGENIPNKELGRYYRSAGLVLNDHWPDMRDKGFVSNRIFDVLACGVPLVSDRVEGLPEDLVPFVRLFDDASSLVKAVDEVSGEDYAAKQARFKLALHVQANHGFDTRAETLIQVAGALSRHRGH